MLQCCCCCDVLQTGYVSRDLGKPCSLIAKRLGSYLFLREKSVIALEFWRISRTSPTSLEFTILVHDTLLRQLDLTENAKSLTAHVMSIHKDVNIDHVDLTKYKYSPF